MNHRAKIVCDVLFDWPETTYGDLEQTILDTLLSKHVRSAIVEIEESGSA